MTGYVVINVKQNYLLFIFQLLLTFKSFLQEKYNLKIFMSSIIVSKSFYDGPQINL